MKFNVSIKVTIFILKYKFNLMEDRKNKGSYDVRSTY
jgi:hypothetical protein